eukprot:jgi/Psemu1/179548/e_gw1.10.14.1
MPGGTQPSEEHDEGQPQLQRQPQRREISVLPTTAFNSEFIADQSNTERRRIRRWFGGGHTNNGASCASENDYSPYWKEARNEHAYNNFYDDLDKEKNCKKTERMDMFHFGRIEQSSIFEGMQGNHHRNSNSNSNDDDEDEEHPLRSQTWKVNVNWSLFSPKTSTSRCSAGQRRRNIKMELHPEGYCRMIGVPSASASASTSAASNRSDENEAVSASVLGIGRWKKRPWGVTVVVRPLLVPESCRGATTPEMANNARRRRDGEKTWEENKNLVVVDEDKEFIFHARGFHWNGFGSNPKLTQGTILLQKRIKKDGCLNWWKSTCSAYSSILPVWPEEVSGEHLDGGIMTNFNDLGSTYSTLLKPGKILNTVRNFKLGGRSTGNGRRWFRPVVGTFTATGII